VGVARAVLLRTWLCGCRHAAEMSCFLTQTLKGQPQTGPLSDQLKGIYRRFLLCKLMETSGKRWQIFETGIGRLWSMQAAQILKRFDRL